jgi:Alpha 1,4-glycosyltransferase conserved region
MKKARFASFWHGGELSPYEIACLSSFAAYGNEVSVYSYEPVLKLPAGIVAKDASQIVSRDSLNDFPVNGIPSMAHFTDYFRFVMFTRTDEIWVDTDMLLLRPYDLGDNVQTIGLETPESSCTALLRLDPNDPRLNELIQRVEMMKGTDIKWGDTGPRLLTSTYGVDSSLPEQYFYPVHFDDYYKVFLPSYFDECEEACADSYSLHLWNNRVVKMALFKRIGPPLGSFLHHVFEKNGSNALFNEFYPTAVMQAMIHNAVEKVGRDEGMRNLMRVAVPSVKAAIGRAFKP